MSLTQSRVSQRLMIPLITTFFLALLGEPPARAQEQSSQTPDMQQMQKKLEQLEKELLELKQQMNAVSALSKQAVPGPSVPVTTDTRQADEHGEQAKVSSSIDFYGFVMTDTGYNFGSINPNWFDVERPTQLPAFAGEYGANGNAYFGVRQTRFGVKTSTATPLGDLKTIFEFELFGTGVDAGQTTFRLRQAYGELGQFGAGQTWSPFMDIDVFPNSLEYWGPNGMVFFRNVQVRWMPIQGPSNVVIALERPGGSADGGVYADRIDLQNIVPHFAWPDLSGHARLARGWGYVQAAGIIRKVGWNDTTPALPNLSGSAIGWGVNLTSNIYFTKKDTGRFEFVYGKAIENYMNDAPVDIGVATNFSNPAAPVKGVALPVLGVVSFLDHTWSERLSTSIGYSFLNISNSDAMTPASFHQGDYALVNLLFHPLKQVTVGSEFQFGRRVNFSDGFNVNDYKVQFSFRYDWSKGFEF
ncbi:MAG: DcaP family trimeric outer membrane transporter [Candidatus Acidiferrales bacterium]